MRFKGRMDHVPHIRVRSGPRLLLRAGGQLRGCLQEKAGMDGEGSMSKVQGFLESKGETVYDEAMGVWHPTVEFGRVTLETAMDVDRDTMLDALHAAIAVLEGRDA